MSRFYLEGNLKVENTEDGERLEVDLSLKNIVEVPVTELAVFPEATALDVSYNLISSLPDSFCGLTHLVRIDLAQNQLTALPEEFGCLVHLEFLDLRANQLTTLPESFRHLRSLVWLDLASNPLTPALREQAGDCQCDSECEDCARNVVSYMKRRHGSQLMYAALKASSFTILALALIMGTVVISRDGGNLRERLYAEAVATCAHVRDGAILSTRLFGHLWYGLAGIFRSGQKASGKESRV